MSEELERSAQLIERLLGDTELRRRFRAEPASVLKEHGLLELAAGLPTGRRALMTLELRESRSSLAGVMVAAAAEGVDFAHLAEHAAPGLGRELAHLTDGSPKHKAHPVATPQVADGQQLPPLAQRTPVNQSGLPQSSSATPAAAPTAVGPTHSPVPAPSTPQPPQPTATGRELPSHGPSGPAAHLAGAVTDGSALQRAAGRLEPRLHQHGGNADPIGSLPDPHHDPLAYPGDNATLQQIAAWMGANAARAGLPRELPVMAALTESGLHNLNYGDRDSVGFFQMRVGTWNQGPYAGYPDHPELQLKWFIDHALEAKAQYPALAGDPQSWGEWVANVEQPAAQFRFRYQLQLATAQGLLKGVENAVTQDASAPVVQHVAPPVREQALKVAERYLGVPYRWGGSSPQTGFDCSGLVQYAYAQRGIQLPRVAAQQFDVGMPVQRHDLRPGDAVFFADQSGIHHVGLYVGQDRFISAPHTGDNVKISSLSDPYFASQYAGARRYTAAALADPSRYARSLPTIGR